MKLSNYPHISARAVRLTFRINKNVSEKDYMHIILPHSLSVNVSRPLLVWKMRER